MPSKAGQIDMNLVVIATMEAKKLNYLSLRSSGDRSNLQSTSNREIGAKMLSLYLRST